ncbi:MAG: alpha/beta fold hydrolase [Arenimonas sp.]|nr:alpha/beta fold hydrolase [Arenimonas sp.]
MEMIRIQVASDDELIAHLFPASTETRRGRSVIVGPATAVAQTYYIKFCTYLAEQGFDVLSFDFRSVGQSMNRAIRDYNNVGFSDWAEHDYPAVIDFMHTQFPNQPLYVVGHSVGGWMPGATRASHRIDGILGVAALSAYWPLMARPHRYGHWLTWKTLVPITTALLGYWPGWAGLTHDLPAKLGREFAQWAQSPDFVFDATQFDARNHAANFKGHLHLYQISDDAWGTPAAVSALQGHYPNAKSNVMETLRPDDFNAKTIGHLSFFRSAHRDTLWPHAVARLTAFG